MPTRTIPMVLLGAGLAAAVVLTLALLAPRAALQQLAPDVLPLALLAVLPLAAFPLARAIRLSALISRASDLPRPVRIALRIAAAACVLASLPLMLLPQAPAGPIAIPLALAATGLIALSGAGRRAERLTRPSQTADALPMAPRHAQAADADRARAA